MTTVFSWPFGEYNVAGSFNYFVKTNLNTSLPVWMAAAPRLNFNYPDVPLFDEPNGVYTPVFSVTHLGKFDESIAAGDLLDNGKMGQKVYGVAEVSAWVNGKAGAQSVNSNWPRDLMTMRDMIIKLFSGTRTINIVDTYASILAPTPIGYILRVDRVTEDQPLEPDPNPNVHRRRILVTFCYLQRQ